MSGRGARAPFNFKRPCKRCGELFRPVGRINSNMTNKPGKKTHICDNCNRSNSFKKKLLQ